MRAALIVAAALALGLFAVLVFGEASSELVDADGHADPRAHGAGAPEAENDAAIEARGPEVALADHQRDQDSEAGGESSEVEVRKAEQSSRFVLVDRATGKPVVGASLRFTHIPKEAKLELSPYRASPAAPKTRDEDQDSAHARELKRLIDQASKARGEFSSWASYGNPLTPAGMTTASDVTTTSGANGNATTPLLPSDEDFQVKFAKKDFWIRPMKIHYVAPAGGEPFELRADVTALAAVNVRLVLADGQSVSEAAIRLERHKSSDPIKDTAASKRVWTTVATQVPDARGRTTFADIHPGAYIVHVAADRGMTHPMLGSRRFFVREGVSQDLEIRVRKVTRLRLDVHVEDRAPPFGYVRLLSINGREQRAHDVKHLPKLNRRVPFSAGSIARHVKGGRCEFLVAQSGRYEFAFTLGFAGREERFFVHVGQSSPIEERVIRLRKALADFRKGFDVRDLPSRISR